MGSEHGGGVDVVAVRLASAHMVRRHKKRVKILERQLCRDLRQPLYHYLTREEPVGL